MKYRPSRAATLNDWGFTVKTRFDEPQPTVSLFLGTGAYTFNVGTPRDMSVVQALRHLIPRARLVSRHPAYHDFAESLPHKGVTWDQYQACQRDLQGLQSLGLDEIDLMHLANLTQSPECYLRDEI